jgi:tRNA G26 N,N-dimethylase Trm1
MNFVLKKLRILAMVRLISANLQVKEWYRSVHGVCDVIGFIIEGLEKFVDELFKLEWQRREGGKKFLSLF